MGIHENTVEALKRRLPVPKRPKAVDDEFDFPDSVSDLDGEEIGQWSLRLTGYLVYAHKKLGDVESEYFIVDSDIKSASHTRGVDIRKTIGRSSADVVESIVIADDYRLEKLHTRRLILTTRRIQLQARISIYERMLQTLSREQARQDIQYKHER